MLILTSLEKALGGLEEVLAMEKNPVVRDSSIQRFEYTYELSVKMLRRYLEMSEPASTTVDELAFKDFIRFGAEKGCITSPEHWFDYRLARNITSHAYDEKKAEEIYAVLPGFLQEAKSLLIELQKRKNDV